MIEPDSEPTPASSLQRNIADGFEYLLSHSSNPIESSLTRTTSMSWPSPRLDESLVPSTSGDLQPELLKIGKHSSLMGAIAIGISSVRQSGNARELFRALSGANKEPLSTTDRVKDVHKRIRAVRNFKLPLLEGIDIQPLANSDPAKLAKRPLPSTFDVIGRGSAIILPLPRGIIREKPRGRQLWSVITGIQEKVVPDEPENTTDVPGHHIETNFAVAIPLRDIGALAMVGEEQFDELVGDAPHAYVISSTDRA
jgi:hypothetical protein